MSNVLASLTLLAENNVSRDMGYWWPAWTVGVLLFIGLLVFRSMSRAGVVARATTKEAIRQPVFLLVLVLSSVYLILSVFIPYFTFGDDVKMLKDCGLVTILVCSLLMAVWTSSTSIAAEIEGKTTMTLLSKPINRRQFILGKYLGIMQAIIYLMVPLSIVFLACIYYKVGYDARESSQTVTPLLEWVDVTFLTFEFQWPKPTDLRWYTMTQIVPGLVLIFFEAAILTAVSVAIATRAPMMVNIVACLAVYVIGHLAPILVQSSADHQLMEFVRFVSQMIATIMPSLELFNTQSAVATGSVVPIDYLGLAAIYCLAYCSAAILLAFLLFEDHDLS